MLPQNFLTTETVATGVAIQSKKRLLEYVAERFASQNRQLEVTTIFEKLIERERLGSTGLGKGIALPHARVDGLAHAQAVFAKLENGIDFDAMDCWYLQKPMKHTCRFLPGWPAFSMKMKIVRFCVKQQIIRNSLTC
jgi:mannitol/fructose-specific phosphotransferase system IIA component (Ntr-type)